MASHFTANPDYRYWGENRFHKYDAPNNPIVARGKPWKVTIDTDKAKAKMQSRKKSKAQLNIAKQQYKNALKVYLIKEYIKMRSSTNLPILDDPVYRYE